MGSGKMRMTENGRASTSAHQNEKQKAAKKTTFPRLSCPKNKKKPYICRQQKQRKPPVRLSLMCMEQTLTIVDINSKNDNGRCTGHFVHVAGMFRKLFSAHVKTRIAGGPVYNHYFGPDELLPLPYDNIEGRWKPRAKWHTLRNCFALPNTPGNILLFQHAALSVALLWLALTRKRCAKIFLIVYYDTLNSPWKRLVYRLAKPKIDGILCPGEEIGQRYERPFMVVPDYFYLPSEEPEVLPYEARAYDFCVVGLISKTKDVAGIIRKIRGTAHRLVVAGKCRDHEYAAQLQQLAAGADNIDLRLDYIPADEYGRLLAQSRYCLMNYTDDYAIRSSGVALDAVFHHTPVVGRQCGALQFIGERSLGFLYAGLEEFDPRSVLSKERFDHCRQGIDAFLQANRQAAGSLIDFCLN